MSAQTRSEIKKLLKDHGLAPVRRLGQHFLADGNITRKIVEVAGVGPGDNVLEVGGGTGTLTRALAGSGAHVVTFEIDRLRPISERGTGTRTTGIKRVVHPRREPNRRLAFPVLLDGRTDQRSRPAADTSGAGRTERGEEVRRAC